MDIKELLSQHNDLEKEVEDIRTDIKNTEESIEKLLKDGTVIDKGCPKQPAALHGWTGSGRSAYCTPAGSQGTL